MKKGILVIAFLSLFCGHSHAQDWKTKLIEGSNDHQYESFVTNDWLDNFFVGIGGGISTKFTAGNYSDITKIKIDPVLDIYVMKWISPVFGIRFGYLGLSSREGLNSYYPYQINHSAFPYKLDSTGEYVSSSGEPGTLTYGSFHLHGDVMWSLMNTFSGYNRNRVFDLGLYVSAGYLRMYDNRTKGNRGLTSKCFDREFTLGGGVYGTYKITDRLLATADLKYYNHASRYRTESGVRTHMPLLTIGVAYNLHKTNWTNLSELKTSLAEAREAEEEAQRRADRIQIEYDKIKKELEQKPVIQDNTEVKDDKIIVVNTMEYSNLKKLAESAGHVTYFYIGQSELNFSEMAHLTTYVEKCLANDKNHVFHITGSADNGTGTEAQNGKLSYARALFIKKCLMTDFGVKEDNITISSVVTDKHLDGAYDRCAIID